MQEQAKAELEKIQAAKDKKEQKEQEKVEKAKAKEEKKREREEKKLKEAAQAEKAKKAAGKQKKAPGSEKGDGKVPEDMETQPATPPKTPKRAAALVATPRQKNMVKRRRQNVAADGQYAPSGSTPNVPGDGGNHKDAKELALLEKIKTNHELLKNVLEFGSDVHYFPSLEDNPSMRSFTVHPYAESRGQKSIGVILFRSSFYVYRANIPDGLQKILDQKGVKGAIGKDSNGGCSLGWTRFKSVQQAYLSLYMLFFETMCVRESLNICYFKMCASLWCLFVSGICVHNDQVLAWLLRWGLAKIVGGWVPEDKMAEHVFEWVIMGTGLPTKWQLPGVFSRWHWVLHQPQGCSIWLFINRFFNLALPWWKLGVVLCHVSDTHGHGACNPYEIIHVCAGKNVLWPVWCGVWPGWVLPG